MPNIEIHGDLIRGHIDTIILKALFDGDRYGYDIIKEIEQKSSGRYQLKQPTLYSSLKRLEEQGFTRSYWSDEKTFGGRKKFYTLTDMGKEVFLRHQRDWLHSRGIIDCLISDETTAEFAAMAHKNIAAYYNSEDAKETVLGQKSDPPEIEDRQDEYIQDVTEEQGKELSEEELEDLFRKVNSDFEVAEMKPQTFNPDFKSLNPGYKVYNQSRDESPSPGSAGKSYAVYPGFKPSVQPVEQALKKDYRQETKENIDVYQADAPQEKEKPVDDTFELDALTNAPRKVVVGEQTPSDIHDVLADFSNSYGEKSYVGDIASRVYTPDYPAPTQKYASNEVDDDEVPYEEYVKTYDDTVELPYQDPAQPAQKTEPELFKSENRFPQFLKYNSPNKPQPAAFTDDDIVKRDYRSALDKLATPKTPSIKNQQQAKLDKLTENARQMGDQVIIRRHDDTMKVYNTENYYYKNKLRLVSSFIVYILILVEIMAMFALHHFAFSSFTVPAAIKNRISPEIIYLSVAVAAFIFFPFLAVVSAFNNLNARKLKNSDIKASVVFRSIVVALLWAIVFFVNFYWGILHSTFTDYIATLILPALVILNFLISLFVHQILLKSGRFNVKN